MTSARLILPLALALIAAAACAGDLPFYAALCTRIAPTVDGALDDACWQHAAWTAPFVAIGGSPVKVATRVMACWDTGNLYVAFICPEPLMKGLADRIARHEVGLFDESIELFLNPSGDRYSYLQLRVDVLGNRDTHRRNDLDEDLTGQWTGAVKRGPDQWTVEMAVPFAMLGSPPAPATLWTCNFNRQRLAQGGPVQWTCWSDTKGGFHSPARFGQLVFTDYRAWLRQYFRDRLAARERDMGDLVLRFPEVAGPLQGELQRLDQDQAAFLGRVAAEDFGGEQDCRALFDQGAALVGAYDQSLAEMRLAVIRDVLR